MKIKIFSLQEDIVFKNHTIPVIIIENKNYFSKIVSNIKCLCQGVNPEERITIEDNGRVIDFEKELLMMIDYFNFDYDSKKLSNALYRHIENIFQMDIERHQKLLESMMSTAGLIWDIIEEIPFNVDQKEKITILDYLKMITLRVQEPNTFCIIDRILNVIDLVAFLQACRVLVFVNVKAFLTDEEIIEVYKYSMYNEVKLLLIETGEPKNILDYEDIIWIDDDYAESRLSKPTI